METKTRTEPRDVFTHELALESYEVAQARRDAEREAAMLDTGTAHCWTEWETGTCDHDPDEEVQS
jgi:hypothetical protein